MNQNKTKQNRRSLNLPTDVYERLSYLQAETRLLMRQQNVEKVLSKTAATGILIALISNTSAKELAKLINKSK